METIATVCSWIAACGFGVFLLFVTLCLIEWCTNKALRVLKTYELIIDYLWHRKEFHEWKATKQEAERRVV